MKSTDHTYRIECITGEGHPKRRIAFLISNDKKVGAKEAFDELGENADRNLRSRFDAWRDGLINKKWFHGWDQSEFGGKYVHCFVFKYQSDRFYGFLCNPIQSRPTCQICILISHDNKNKHETDEVNLKEIEEIRLKIAVHQIIGAFFKEKK